MLRDWVQDISKVLTEFFVSIPRLNVLLAGLAFAALTMYTSITTGANYLSGKSSLQWPKVPGRVTTSEAVYQPGAKAGAQYRLKLRYLYSFDGKEYLGDRVRFFTPHGDGVQEAVKRYPVGHQPVVSVNPRNPEESCLEPGFDERELKSMVAVNLFSAFLVVVSLFIGMKRGEPNLDAGEAVLFYTVLVISLGGMLLSVFQR